MENLCLCGIQLVWTGFSKATTGSIHMSLRATTDFNLMVACRIGSLCFLMHVSQMIKVHGEECVV